MPLNTKLKEIEKERDERRKVRRKTKAKAQEDAATASVTNQPAQSTSDVDMEPAMSSQPVAGVIEEESTARKREIETLTSLIHSDLAADVGCSPHGLYELCGKRFALTL